MNHCSENFPINCSWQRAISCMSFEQSNNNSIVTITIKLKVWTSVEPVGRWHIKPQNQLVRIRMITWFSFFHVSGYDIIERIWEWITTTSVWLQEWSNNLKSFFIYILCIKDMKYDTSSNGSSFFQCSRTKTPITKQNFWSPPATISSPQKHMWLLDYSKWSFLQRFRLCFSFYPISLYSQQPFFGLNCVHDQALTRAKLKLLILSWFMTICRLLGDESQSSCPFF